MIPRPVERDAVGAARRSWTTTRHPPTPRPEPRAAGQALRPALLGRRGRGAVRGGSTTRCWASLRRSARATSRGSAPTTWSGCSPATTASSSGAGWARCSSRTRRIRWRSACRGGWSARRARRCGRPGRSAAPASRRRRSSTRSPSRPPCSSTRSRTWIARSRSGGLVCRDRLEALQRIFEHELLHLAEFLGWGRSNCRAENFHALSRRIFAHEGAYPRPGHPPRAGRRGLRHRRRRPGQLRARGRAPRRPRQPDHPPRHRPGRRPGRPALLRRQALSHASTCRCRCCARSKDLSRAEDRDGGSRTCWRAEHARRGRRSTASDSSRRSPRGRPDPRRNTRAPAGCASP